MMNTTGTAASIVVCSTCRLSEDQLEDAEGRRGGALLLESMRAAAAEHRNPDIAVDAMSCLFACSHSCTVHLRAEGKISYVLGGFSATREDANAILDYFERYLASKEGVVPYSDWPEGIKGHFITRSPPVGKTVI